MKKVYTLLFLLTLSIEISASPPCIGVVTSGTSSFWKVLVAGAQQAAKEVGIIIYSRGAIGDDDVNGQHHIINQAMYTEKCQGLLLAPNSQVHLKTIELLKKQGIPTVYIDRDVGGARVSVVKTNNALAGRLAGQAMLKALNGKGNIVVLGFKKGIIATENRRAAFLDVTRRGGLKIKTIEYLATRVGEARLKAFDILNTEENIDGIFTDNEITTVATILALRKMNKLGKVVHIGFDSNQLIFDSKKSLNLHGFVLQDAFQMGYQGVHTLYKAMQGEKVNENITTNIIYVDKNNINRTDIKRAVKLYQK